LKEIRIVVTGDLKKGRKKRKKKNEEYKYTD